MKNPLSATIYEKEASCVDEILAIANEMKKKPYLMQKTAETPRYPNTKHAVRRSRN